MTQRLFFENAYLTEFEARPLRVQREGERTAVVLDATAFYPTSGGQPHDLGELGGARVLNVEERGAEIVHLLDRAPDSGPVLRGRVDPDRRRDHREQHSGQHLLSAAFVQLARAETSSFHLGAEECTIDLSRPALGPDDLDAAEDLANRIVRECRPVRPTIHSAAEAKALPLRKPPAVEGDVRVVTVEGFDVSACGGTHVARTGEVGQIRVLGAEKTKGLLRVSFVCGGRALLAARRKGRLLEALRGAAGTSEPELPAAFGRLRAEGERLRKAHQETSEALLAYEARELFAAAPGAAGGTKLVVKTLDGREMKELSWLADRIAREGRCVVLLGGRGERASLAFVRSEGIDLDLRKALEPAAREIEGKGGGRPNFVQAGGSRREGVEAALAAARAWVAAALGG
ncbi:MAG: hypothetical protein HYZ53_24650 [Planctomycetes bacterium]|nr:hypothetical protein [Planctomycetota bacterium]